MKVKKIYVQNLRQIDEQEANFDWCTCIVTGGNNKGKTTLLRSIVERLRGTKTKIIKEGKETWKCEWTFTDWSVLTRNLEWEKEKIEYITKEWIKTSAIKTICEKLFGKWFDIDKFLWSPPKEQKKTLQQLVWLDFEEIDQKYQQAYDDRTYANNVYKAEKTKLESINLQEIQWEKKDIEEMQNKLIEIEKTNEKIHGVQSRLEDKEKRIKSIEDEIQRLQSEKKDVEQEVKKWKDWLNENKEQDTQVIRDKIEKQKQINKIHEEHEQYEQQKEAMEMAKKEQERLDEKVKQIENQKLEMIKSVWLPKWFEFTSDGILFNWFGLSRDTLSSSQTYIAWLMLASMNIWDVHTLTFDASYLDKNSLKEVQERADSQWLQLLIERPDFDWGEIKYEIIS